MRNRQAIEEKLAYVEFLERLLEDEVERRGQKQLLLRLRRASFNVEKTLEGFDWSFNPNINRQEVFDLATCAWIDRKEVLLLVGPSGTGKSHLAAALGVKAVEHRFGVVFYRLDELLSLLRRDADLSPTRLRRKKYVSTSLLVIDEVGFDPMNRQEASLFFRLVSQRYQRGSIHITTNKGIKDWPEILAGDEVLATAILDRLLHNSYVLGIKGRSFRLRDLERAVVGER